MKISQNFVAFSEYMNFNKKDPARIVHSTLDFTACSALFGVAMLYVPRNVISLEMNEMLFSLIFFKEKLLANIWPICTVKVMHYSM